MKKHTKRYMLVFRIEYGVEKTEYKSEGYDLKASETEEEFDTLSEANDLIKEYTELYKDDLKPEKHNAHYVHRVTGEIKGWVSSSYGYNIDDWKYVSESWDWSDGRKRWGYYLIDFEEERVIKDGGDRQVFEYMTSGGSKSHVPYEHRKCDTNLKGSLTIKDILFRKDDEVPKGYVWTPGEYDGWLQFRWGDGKNSITYIEPPKKTKEEVHEEATEEDLQKYLSNYEPVHTTNDQEVEFNEDTINYLETTQQMQKIINTAIEKDVDYFSVNESEWSSKNPWSDIKPVTILTDEEKRIIEEDWDEDDLLDESNYQEEFNEWWEQRHINKDINEFKNKEFNY